MRNWSTRAAAFGAAVALSSIVASNASAQLQITEWMYQATNGEYVELTNTGGTALDLTNWTFDDLDLVDNNFVDLGQFGTIAAGESVVLIQGAVGPDDVEIATFRTAWNLGAGVKIGSLNDIGFGRQDTLNVFNSGTLADTFAYGDNTVGGPRTQNVSGNIPFANLGDTVSSSALPLSFVGDSFGSFTSSGNDIGNPGQYIVPEPATLSVLGAAGAMILRRKRR